MSGALGGPSRVQGSQTTPECVPHRSSRQRPPWTLHLIGAPEATVPLLDVPCGDASIGASLCERNVAKRFGDLPRGQPQPSARSHSAAVNRGQRGRAPGPSPDSHKAIAWTSPAAVPPLPARCSGSRYRSAASTATRSRSTSRAPRSSGTFRRSNMCDLPRRAPSPPALRRSRSLQCPSAGTPARCFPQDIGFGVALRNVAETDARGHKDVLPVRRYESHKVSVKVRTSANHGNCT